MEGPGELELGECPSANPLQKDRGEREYQLEICLVERESAEQSGGRLVFEACRE